MTSETGFNYEIVTDANPTTCVFCHKTIDARIGQVEELANGKLEVVYQCPDPFCNKLFISYYQHNKELDQYLWTGNILGRFLIDRFAETVKHISESFTEIYNQAFITEQMGLDRISGMGYRKAFEFLIKDYVISHSKKDEKKIKNMNLGSCISEYIKDKEINEMAIRAAWLGNDETHYERRWVDKDIRDLKSLIEITIYWILKKEKTAEYIKNMPKK
jgi:hypothetical protein